MVELASLTGALDDPFSTGSINWTKLRGFIDWTTCHPRAIPTALIRPPERTDSPLLDNLLAGMAEKLCDDRGEMRPGWCALVPGLDAPYVTIGTPLMQQRTRQQTPPQLARRNVFVTESSLWRTAQ